MAREMLSEGPAMTINNATTLIKSCAEKMNALYHAVVFDEWAIVSLTDNKGYLLAYMGPRKEGFQKDFLRDAGCLRAALLAQKHTAGDFEFTHDGAGTGFESFTALGEGVYLICNNTAQTMDGIVKDPRWLGAQIPFVELSEAFRGDPVSLAR